MAFRPSFVNPFNIIFMLCPHFTFLLMLHFCSHSLANSVPSCSVWNPAVSDHVSHHFHTRATLCSYYHGIVVLWCSNDFPLCLIMLALVCYDCFPNVFIIFCVLSLSHDISVNLMVLSFLDIFLQTSCGFLVLMLCNFVFLSCFTLLSNVIFVS